MSTYEALAVPPNTKVLSVQRLSHSRWAIWILTNESGLKRPHWERDGTYLLLDPDGSIDRITISGGETVDIVRVLPPTKWVEGQHE